MHLRSRWALVFVIAFALVACGGSGAPATSSSTGPLSGKKVLVVPYWLDQFNTANTSWISRLLTAAGAKVDVINPDKSASRQLDIIETAIANKSYNAIAWQ